MKEQWLVLELVDLYQRSGVGENLKIEVFKVFREKGQFDSEWEALDTICEWKADGDDAKYVVQKAYV